VFGNPAGGAKLLALDLAAAVDIPLRLAVIGTEPGRSEIVQRDMHTLLAGEAVELAAGFTTLLHSLAEQAAELASSR
jgi:uncharacterized protein (DUF302 family)